MGEWSSGWRSSVCGWSKCAAKVCVCVCGLSVCRGQVGGWSSVWVVKWVGGQVGGGQVGVWPKCVCVVKVCGQSVCVWPKCVWVLNR